MDIFKQHFDAIISDNIARLDSEWQSFFQAISNQEWWHTLLTNLAFEYQNKQIYPAINQLFAALSQCPLKTIKVVILGQDPYHTPNVANGLAFAVNHVKYLTPSLKNIYQKLANEYHLNSSIRFLDLKHWAQQGVLLINTTWSVIAHQANSHHHLGWDQFTNYLLRYLIAKQPLIIFVGWGKFAQNLILNLGIKSDQYFFSSHPSPFSANISFFKRPLFIPINERLKLWKLPLIDWIKGAEF